MSSGMRCAHASSPGAKNRRLRAMLQSPEKRRPDVHAGGTRSLGSRAHGTGACDVARNCAQAAVEPPRDHVVQTGRGRTGCCLPDWRRHQQFELEPSSRTLDFGFPFRGIGLALRFVYELGGFEIRSTFPLPLRRAVPRPEFVAATIHVDTSSGPVPHDGPVVYRWPGRYKLTLSALDAGWLLTTSAHGAAFISTDGRSIVCYPDSAASPDWPDVLVRRILPRLAQWHGRIALHAATVSDGRTATILLGPSGAGKSTLAAALRQHVGWRVLSDDICLVDGDTVPPVALPTGAGLCLWPDSLSPLVPSVSDCRIVAGHDEKRWLEDNAEAPEPRRAVTAILVLSADGAADQHAAIAIHPVAPRDAAIYAGAQMMCFNPSDPGLFARSWAAVGRLVDVVPTFSLAYPRGYERLAEVATSLASRLSVAAPVTT